MKKYIALITLMISASAFGYTVKIINKTGEQIKAKLKLALDPLHTFMIGANRIKTIDVGIKCTQTLTAHEMKGGKLKTSIVPPLKSCGSHTFTVTKAKITRK